MIPSSKGSNRRTILERNKLFQTTNIASFGHIQSSNSKIETIIWYIVIIVFTILTIRNIITITLEYQNQKPIAAAWLEEWNGDLGDIFVEFPIILPELYNEFYEPHIIYPFPNHYNRSLGADLEKAIAQLDSREKLIGKNSSWPYILLPLMIRFAELMYAFEFPLSAGSEEYITSLSVNELAHDLHMQRVFPYIQNFLNHSAQFNVTHSDLINKWTEELVDQIFRVSFEDRSNGASEVLTPEMFHLMILFKDKYVDQNPTGSVVYRMGFAFKRKLKLSQMHFWRWSFSYKRLIDVVLESGVFDSNFTIDQARHWYLRSFNHKPELAIYKDYYLYDLTSVKVGQDMIKEVKVIYSFRSIGQNCSRKTPAWKCYAKCVTKYFTDTCQCSPLSFDHSHVNTTPCTMDKYVGCRIGQQVARADLHCYEMCPEHCTQDIMSYIPA